VAGPVTAPSQHAKYENGRRLDSVERPGRVLRPTYWIHAFIVVAQHGTLCRTFGGEDCPVEATVRGADGPPPLRSRACSYRNEVVGHQLPRVLLATKGFETDPDGSRTKMVHQTFVWVICQCRSRALLPSPTGRGTEVREKRLRIHVSSLTPTPLPEGEGLSCIDAPTQKSEGPQK